MFLLAAIFAAITLPVAHLVNSIVPNAYMDEIFHIPQAQNYCEWKFSTWDPMITTFPGLYLLSFIFKPVMFLLFSESQCTAKILRSINLLLSICCVLLFRGILLHLGENNKHRSGGATLKALVLGLFPLHWFFTFLYYTDTGSTAAVMAMYLACLKRAYWLSALLSIVAIMFRQTNAVWTVFVLCVAIIQFLQENPAGDGSRSSKTERFKVDDSMKHSTDAHLRHLLMDLWKRRWEAVRIILPYVAVVSGFIVFVFYNGSIVVGAKDAHRVSPHFAQLLYVAVFIAGTLAPFHFSFDKFHSLRNSFQRRPILASGIALAAIACSLLVVHHFSLAHAYLLADNRHYTFYIWKDLIQSHWTTKYLLTPVYIYSWWSIIKSLKTTLNINSRCLQALWILSFLGASSAALVPAPLVEFRYFTIPFYIVALHTLSGARVSSWKLWAVAVEFLVVNIITMHLFLYRPFSWPHEAGTQRFLW